MEFLNLGSRHLQVSYEIIVILSVICYDINVFWKEICMKKKILLGLSATLMLVMVTGCGKVAQLDNGQDAVVTFSDESVGAISVNELYEELRDTYGASILVDMVDRKILEQKYPTDDDETAEIEAQIATWTSAFGSESAMLQQTASAFGAATMDDLRDYLSLQYKRNLWYEDYAKEQVTDQERQNYYDQQVFGEMKLSHILIRSTVSTSASDEEKAAAEEEAYNKAVELIKQLDEGASFDDLAKENSEDSATAEDGGDLGYITWTDNMDENFIDAAKDLEVGKYTATPVKSSYGYHIILKEEQKDKESLDSIKDTITERVAEDNLSEDSTISTRALMALRENYGIHFEDDRLENSYDIYMQILLNSASSN